MVVVAVESLTLLRNPRLKLTMEIVVKTMLTKTERNLNAIVRYRRLARVVIFNLRYHGRFPSSVRISAINFRSIHQLAATTSRMTR